jgi:STE24 endopeptidase
MQIVLILAVAAALVIAESGPVGPASDTAARLAAAGLGIALVTLFAAMPSGMVARRIRREGRPTPKLRRTCRRLRQAHLVLWLAVAGGIAYGLDWGQLVRFNWHLDRAFLVDDVLILLPVVLPLVLSWAVFYDTDRLLLGGGSETVRVFPSRGQYLALHVRHHLGMVLLPVLILLAVQDAAQRWMPEALEGDYAMLVFAPPLVVLLGLFPLFLRYVWRTRPLEAGPLRTRLEAAAARHGFRIRDILVWQTDSMVVNAAVAGFLPRLRYVFLTDGLLEWLGDEEIEAVFGHELGHVRHRHVPLRVAAMLLPLSLWLLISQTCPPAADSLESWLGTGDLASRAPLALVALAAMAAYVLAVFGFYSRRLESQADLFACRFRDGAYSPETLVSALEKLADAQGSRRARSWQHASVARRVEILQALARDEKRELRYHRRVHLLGCMVVGLAISPVISPLLILLLLG